MYKIVKSELKVEIEFKTKTKMQKLKEKLKNLNNPQIDGEVQHTSCSRITIWKFNKEV